MRKNSLLVFLAALVLLLAGCNSSGPAQDADSRNAGQNPDAQVENQNKTPGSVGDSAAPDAQAKTDTAPGTRFSQSRSVVLPVVGVSTHSASHYMETLNRTVNTMEESLPGVDADTRDAYPALAETLDRFREDLLDSAKEAYAVREEIIEEILEDTEEEFSYFPLYSKSKTYVRRADTQAVSFAILRSEYTGGIHEFYGYVCLNLDTASGQVISLDSLLSDTGREALNSRIAEELDRLYPHLAPGEMVLDYVPEQYTFSLEPDGVTIWFDPYEIATFGDGVLTVKLYFDRDADLFTGEYAAAENAWSIEFPNTLPLAFSPDGGATTRNVEVWTIFPDDEEADWAYGFGVELDCPPGADRWEGHYEDWDEWTCPEGRNIQREQTFVMDIHPCYCHTPEGEFLMAAISKQNDVPETYLYRLEDGTPLAPLEFTGPAEFPDPVPQEDGEDEEDWSYYPYYRTALTDPYQMPMATQVSLFGTWYAEGPWCFTPDGIALNGEYMDVMGPVVLTLQQDLTVYPVSPDNLFYTFETPVTLKEGTEITLAAFDGTEACSKMREKSKT